MYITILPRDALSVLKRRGADLFQPVLDGDRIELGELVKMCVRRPAVENEKINRDGGNAIAQDSACN